MLKGKDTRTTSRLEAMVGRSTKRRKTEKRFSRKDMNLVLNSMLGLLWWENPADNWNRRSELWERPWLET